MSRRTSELGIRMALGAVRGEVLWMILRESLIICAVGVLVGLPLAWTATRIMGSLLYGVAPHDPTVMILAAFCITAATLAASYLPAMRAASVDPMVALRYE